MPQVRQDSRNRPCRGTSLLRHNGSTPVKKLPILSAQVTENRRYAQRRALKFRLPRTLAFLLQHAGSRKADSSIDGAQKISCACAQRRRSSCDTPAIISNSLWMRFMATHSFGCFRVQGTYYHRELYKCTVLEKKLCLLFKATAWVFVASKDERLFQVQLKKTISLKNSVEQRKVVHPSTGSGRTSFSGGTHWVIYPFALSSPLRGRVEGRLIIQQRFLG